MADQLSFSMGDRARDVPRAADACSTRPRTGSSYSTSVAPVAAVLGWGRFYPEAWYRFRQGVPETERDDLVRAYHRLLHLRPELEVRLRAARDWCAWEDAASPMPDGIPNPRYDDEAFQMTFARLVTHYFHHQAWLAEDQILVDAHRLSGIPGVLIHGRADVGGPPWTSPGSWPRSGRTPSCGSWILVTPVETR